MTTVDLQAAREAVLSAVDRLITTHPDGWGEVYTALNRFADCVLAAQPCYYEFDGCESCAEYAARGATAPRCNVCTARQREQERTVNLELDTLIREGA